MFALELLEDRKASVFDILPVLQRQLGDQVLDLRGDAAVEGATKLLELTDEFPADIFSGFCVLLITITVLR